MTLLALGGEVAGRGASGSIGAASGRPPQAWPRAEHRGQRHRAEADAAALEEVPTGRSEQERDSGRSWFAVLVGGRHSRVMNSSRLAARGRRPSRPLGRSSWRPGGVGVGLRIGRGAVRLVEQGDEPVGLDRRRAAGPGRGGRRRSSRPSVVVGPLGEHAVGQGLGELDEHLVVQAASAPGAACSTGPAGCRPGCRRGRRSRRARVRASPARRRCRGRGGSGRGPSSAFQARVAPGRGSSRRRAAAGRRSARRSSGLSRPLATSAESRISSASSRSRDCRASRRLSGSTSASSGRSARRLPVGRRGHDQPVHRLEAPAPVDELGGQPVEQLGMARRRALRAEVLVGLDEPPAEVRLPEPVDRDPGRQRVLRVDQPAGQVEPVGRLVRRDRQRRQHGRHAGLTTRRGG